MTKGKAYTGTSGWTYPEWNGVFYPPAVKGTDQLIHYAARYNAVEVNATFYRWPLVKTVENWAVRTPDDFRFALKIWRGLSEKNDVMEDKAVIDDFLARLGGLREKAAPLLLQLPPSRGVEGLDELDKLIGHIRAQQWDLAVEFRNPSWYAAETRAMLDRHEAALVSHDMKGSGNELVNDKAPFLYRRYHGAGGKYKGTYDEKTLERHAKDMRAAMAEGRDVYAFFNNTMDGAALGNAKTLRAMLE